MKFPHAVISFSLSAIKILIDLTNSLTLRLPYVVSIDFWQYKVEVEVNYFHYSFVHYMCIT